MRLSGHPALRSREAESSPCRPDVGKSLQQALAIPYRLLWVTRAAFHCEARAAHTRQWGFFMNIRSMLLTGLTACGIFSSLPAFAGGLVSGNIVNVYVRQNDGLVFFALDGAISGRAACAVSNNLWVLPMENSETSRRQYAALLAARASNLPVAVQGSGTCTRWVNSEDVDTLIF